MGLHTHRWEGRKKQIDSDKGSSSEHLLLPGFVPFVFTAGDAMENERDEIFALMELTV